MIISGGGAASNTTVNWGALTICSGGVANSTILNRYCSVSDTFKYFPDIFVHLMIP